VKIELFAILDPMFAATGFITAGGRSARMGSDKAWLEIEGEPLIKRTLAALRPVTSSMAIIANTDAYNSLGVPVFGDEHHGVGPLEAVRVALSNTQTRRVLLVGCDLPFVTSALFSFLLSQPSTNEAVVPLSADNQPEPLCAIYCKDSLPIVVDLIERGERKMARLFELVPTRFVEFEEIRGLEGARLFFENINTPEDYERTLRLVNRAQPPA
jgi:molybdopterin-guanine dinucleotide biosynthesis protein A